MRYIELLVTDLTDDTDPTTHTEWIHRDHIETIEPYTTSQHDPSMLWLELTLTSGRTRYIPLQPTRPEEIDTVAAAAIGALLDTGHQPVRAAIISD